VSERPFKLAIAALGGQGGGVLTGWLVQAAEAEGYLVQTTSVPGVAQRTGATIYYLEMFSRAAAERAGRDPVLALMPAAGDVDCVIAAELAEAGRAIQRGIVTPDRTTLIASSHRVLTIGEKSALGRGAVDEAALVELARASSKRLVLFDMAALAERHDSLISATLFGALAGAAVLPFGPAAFRDAIRASGIAVERNLAAFDAACETARIDTVTLPASSARPPLRPLPAQARSAAGAALLERIRARVPLTVQPLALEGVRRLIDYQDPAYAATYLHRLEIAVALDEGERGWQLSAAVARSLALWMSFEDTIRIADLKTRSARFERVRAELRAPAGQVVGVTEFLKPRVAEIAGTLPESVGRWVLRSPRLLAAMRRLTGGRRVRTSSISGYLFLRAIAGLARMRRRTLRFSEEDAAIRAWLGRIESVAPQNYALAVEIARAQRLVKGYGETHESGMRNFTTLMSCIEALLRRPDGAAVFAALHEAALADEHGVVLERTLQAQGLMNGSRASDERCVTTSTA
jgi:indolepyruvate ferredoxin oxidoreductase, beta subunit